MTAILILCAPAIGAGQTVDELLNSAQQEMDLWNHDEALVLYDQAIELDDSRPRVFFMRGMAKRETGDRSGALEDFDRALSMTPDEPEYLYERAMDRFYVQDYQGAVEDCGRFLELLPSNDSMVVLRARARDQLRDYAGAVADFTAALAMTPDDPELHYLRAYSFAALEDWSAAIEDFTVVMTMDPHPNSASDHREMALLRRANVKLSSGDHQGALEDCEKALERDAQDLEAVFIRGMTRLAMQEYGEAVADFNSVIAQYPLPEAFQQRSLAKLELGDEDGAKQDMEKALELGFEE